MNNKKANLVVKRGLLFFAKRRKGTTKVELQQEIRVKLLELAEERYRIFASGLLPETEGILGVRLPLLRRIARRLSVRESMEYLTEIDKPYFEETMLQGMILGYLSLPPEERLEKLREFIPRITNWSVCDSSCVGFKFMREDREQWFDFLKEYFISPREFECRFAAACFLYHFMEEEWIVRILTLAGEFTAQEYYAKMSVAWMLSFCFIKSPKRTEEFLFHESTDEFIFKKTIQKIRESRCVSQEEKRRLQCKKRS